MVFLDQTAGWVVGKGAIYHTADGGETWTLQYDLTRTTGLWLWSIQFVSRTEGWAAGDAKQLLHTVDAGRTWRSVRVRHPRIGPYDTFTSVHFLSPQVGVVAGQHHKGEQAAQEGQQGGSRPAFGYHRPYLLVTFDGGRSWTYHDLPIPVGRWS
jgi:photosystem II stability/assembly factor-like uncharacterized protein